MFDNNWELIEGEAAHDIEVLNYSNQINVIEALVRYMMHHSGLQQNAASVVGCTYHPNVHVLKELHRTGTLFLLFRPGEFRDTEVHVVAQDGVQVYDPPTQAEVQTHIDQFFVDLEAMWPTASPLDVAAFALWKLNWIHPFKNGNGRCARAFTYTCLCLKFGMLLPGAPTVIELVMNNRVPYEAALKAADKVYAETGNVDVSQMHYFLEGLLIAQLSSIQQSAPGQA